MFYLQTSSKIVNNESTENRSYDQFNCYIFTRTALEIYRTVHSVRYFQSKQCFMILEL